ncbi:unnamed protein product [Closterium sp. Yama58-4]|nr:unnamed protein product [Closterium sp. Yama58-4]
MARLASLLAILLVALPLAFAAERLPPGQYPCPTFEAISTCPDAATAPDLAEHPSVQFGQIIETNLRGDLTRTAGYAGMTPKDCCEKVDGTGFWTWSADSSDQEYGWCDIWQSNACVRGGSEQGKVFDSNPAFAYTFLKVQA